MKTLMPAPKLESRAPILETGNARTLRSSDRKNRARFGSSLVAAPPSRVCNVRQKAARGLASKRNYPAPADSLDASQRNATPPSAPVPSHPPAATNDPTGRARDDPPQFS